MMKVIKSEQMGKSERGWLHSTFHFSFAEYYNPKNMHFGALRVVNDDIFDAGNGFDTHPHKNMEIISYVIDGTLTHQDSMGNRRELTRGQVQYMSAGTGVFHSEHNLGKEPLRFLQIWILPDKNGYAPQYGDYPYRWEERKNQWLCIASNTLDNSSVVLHQDVAISVLSLDKGKRQAYSCKAGRMLYLIQLEGSGRIKDQVLTSKDAVELKEEDLDICALSDAHYIIFDLVAN
ncbi:pirin family protein [Amedibacillus sp. YH-ame10]